MLALGCLMWWWAEATVQVFAAGGVFWLLWCVLAFDAWRRSPVGRLQWDARASPAAVLVDTPAGGWLWHGSGREAQALQRVDWMLDAQRVVLLRLHAAGQRPKWVWLEARRDPLRWDDLRRALCAHARGGGR